MLNSCSRVTPNASSIHVAHVVLSRMWALFCATPPSKDSEHRYARTPLAMIGALMCSFPCFICATVALSLLNQAPHIRYAVTCVKASINTAHETKSRYSAPH